MNSDRDERIRIRAHEIWEREGRPEGRHDEHWEQARQEIDAEGPGPSDLHQDDASAAEEGNLAGNLQPGGTGPGAGVGSIGAGGGSTRGRASGGPKRSAKRTASQ